MAKYGNCDFKEIKKFQDKMEKLQKEKEVEQFIELCAKELTARLLRKVMSVTQPGKYPKSVSKTGGTLRRGWTGGVEKVSDYIDNVDIIKVGDYYKIEVTNNVEYASYVEYGHRTRDHKNWVPGKFYLTMSEEELKRITPGVLNKKLKIFMESVFDDK